MRMKITLAAALATAGAAAITMLNAPTAGALPCPQGTRYQVVASPGGHPVGTCLPYFQPCDPGTCDPPPTGAPRN